VTRFSGSWLTACLDWTAIDMNIISYQLQKKNPFKSSFASLTTTTTDVMPSWICN
jgi:hypothetical protein